MWTTQRIALLNREAFIAMCESRYTCSKSQQAYDAKPPLKQRSIDFSHIKNNALRLHKILIYHEN